MDADHPRYESADGDRHDDFALRYSHYFGAVDIGIHGFDGTAREPRFVVAPEGDRLLPLYEQMTQVGVDLQYTSDQWLLKLEALRRRAASDDFAAAVAGFEYTVFGVRQSAADVGLLFEYLYDDRSEHAPPTVFDNDVFIGSRLALNDASDTSLLAGAVIDLDTQETFLNIEAETRVGDRIVVELRLRLFSSSEPGESLHTFANDDYLQLGFDWHY